MFDERAISAAENKRSLKFGNRRGCLKSWLLFRHPREFKIKSLYSNDLILNIASKSKETVQKLQFLDSPEDCELRRFGWYWIQRITRLSMRKVECLGFASNFASSHYPIRLV